VAPWSEGPSTASAGSSASTRLSRILYPHPDNKELLYSWVRLENIAFQNRTHLDGMEEQGVQGISLVADYLENVLMREKVFCSSKCYYNGSLHCCPSL
jgi:hypothetical protein